MWRRISEAMGERDIWTPLRFRIDTGSTFIPVESKWRGYRINRKDQKITIRRVSPSNFINQPLYYFRGKLELDEKSSILTGRVAMVPLTKAFLLFWWSGYIVGLLPILSLTVFQAVRYVVAPEASKLHDLTTLGFMSGLGVAVGVFALLLSAVIQAFSASQRQKLIAFCFGTLPHRER